MCVGKEEIQNANRSRNRMDHFDEHKIVLNYFLLKCPDKM
jgi:hypothetical protein